MLDGGASGRVPKPGDLGGDFGARPGAHDLEALVAGAELVLDRVALLVPELEEPRRERPVDLGIDCGNDLEPPVALELALGSNA